ncbi:CNT_collapsed_G0015910.mRNA.1.CDS.1 [Saccharomyces cerevisiae]|nr:CNT_collapsed_G0015910.mRNA.1.CDS.1 [Saccharomyces cerevisiae]
MLAYTFPSFNFYVNGFFSFLSFSFPLFTTFLCYFVPPPAIATYPLNRCQQYSSLAILPPLAFGFSCLCAKSHKARQHIVIATASWHPHVTDPFFPFSAGPLVGSARSRRFSLGFARPLFFFIL